MQLLDVLHEDLNRVKDKPQTENSEEEGRPEEVVAKEHWDNFLARNQSIIVDLMYGQIKSTITCLTCKRLAIKYDPFGTLQLPLVKTEEESPSPGITKAVKKSLLGERKIDIPGCFKIFSESETLSDNE